VTKHLSTTAMRQFTRCLLSRSKKPLKTNATGKHSRSFERKQNGWRMKTCARADAYVSSQDAQLPKFNETLRMTN